MSLFELWQLFTILLRIEYHFFNGQFPDYLLSFFNFSETFVIAHFEQGLSIAVFITASCIVFIGWGLVVCGCFQSNSELKSIQLRENITTCYPAFLSIFLGLFKKVLFFYIAYTSAQAFSCNEVAASVKCYSEWHFFLLAIGVLNLVLAMTLIGIITLLFQDEKPSSLVPWALSGAKLELLSAFKVLFSAIVSAVDDEYNLSLVYLLILFLTDCALLYFHLFRNTFMYFYVQAMGIATCCLTAIFELYLMIVIVIFF